MLSTYRITHYSPFITPLDTENYIIIVKDKQEKNEKKST